jgi:Lsr2
MARIYIPATGECELLDDIDFMAEARTVCFSLDGTHYEVDLSTSNLQKLRDYLQPFINISHIVRRDHIS